MRISFDWKTDTLTISGRGCTVVEHPTYLIIDDSIEKSTVNVAIEDFGWLKDGEIIGLERLTQMSENTRYDRISGELKNQSVLQNEFDRINKENGELKEEVVRLKNQIFQMNSEETYNG